MTPSIATFAERHKRLSAAIRQGTVRDVSKIISHYAGVLKDSGGIPTSLALSNPASAQVDQIDDRLKAIPFIVTVLQEDRDGDVVIPKGISVENYVNNAVVFFGHQEWVVPIGSAKNPRTKRLAWNATEHEARSICYFDHADPDAMFIYGKVQRGFLSATSIAFVPLEAQKRDEYDKAYRGDKDSMMPVGWLFKRVDLTEWSIVGVPSNAGAIRDALDSEKSFITPRLQKALVPYAAQPRGRCFSGWCPVPAKAIARPPVQKGATSVTTKGINQTLVQMHGSHPRTWGSDPVAKIDSIISAMSGKDCADTYRALGFGDAKNQEEARKKLRSMFVTRYGMTQRVEVSHTGGVRKSLTVTKSSDLVADYLGDEWEQEIWIDSSKRSEAQNARWSLNLDLVRSGEVPGRPDRFMMRVRGDRAKVEEFKQRYMKAYRKSLTVTKDACPNNGRMTLSDDYGCPAAFDSMRKGKAACEGCGKSLDLVPFKLKGKSKMVLQSTTISKLAQRRKGNTFDWMGTIDGKRAGFVVAGDDIRAWVGPNQFKGKVVWNQLKINWEYPLPDTPDRYLLEHEVFTNAKSKAKKAPCSCSGSCGGKGSCSNGKSLNSTSGTSGGYLVQEQFEDEDMTTKRKPAAKKSPARQRKSLYYAYDGGKWQWMDDMAQPVQTNKPAPPGTPPSTNHVYDAGHMEWFLDKSKSFKRKSIRKGKSPVAGDKVIFHAANSPMKTGVVVTPGDGVRTDSTIRWDDGRQDKMDLHYFSNTWNGSAYEMKSRKSVRKDNAEETAQEEATEHGADMDVVETAMEENPEVFAGDETPEEESAEEAAIEAVKAPHSAYALAMSHQHLKALKDYIAAEDEVFEPDSGVRKYLKEKLEPDLDHHMEKMGEMFGARYPNQEMSKLCGGPSEDKAEIEEEDVVTKGRRRKSDLFGAKCPNCGNKVTESGDQVFCPKCDWIGSIDQTKGRRKSVKKNMILSIYVPPEKVNSIRSRIEGSGGKVRINGNEGGLTKLTMEGDDRQIGWAVSEDEGPRRNRPFKPFEDSKDGETDYLEEKNELDAMDGETKALGDFVVVNSGRADPSTKNPDRKTVERLARERQAKYPNWDIEIARETERGYEIINDFYPHEKAEEEEEVEKLLPVDEVASYTHEKGEFEEEEIIASDDLNGTEDADHMTEEEADEIVDESTEEILERYAAETAYKGKGRRKMAVRKSFSEGEAVVVTTLSGDRKEGTIAAVYQGQTRPYYVNFSDGSSGTYREQDVQKKSFRKSRLSLKNLSGRWFVKQVTKDGEELHGPYDTVDEATEVKAEMETEEEKGQTVEVRILPALASPGKFMVGSVRSGHLANDAHEGMLFNSEAEARQWATSQGYTPVKSLASSRRRTKGAFDQFMDVKDGEEIEIEEKDGDEIAEEVEMEDDDPVEKDALEDDEEVVEMAAKGKRRQAKSAASASFDDWISRVEALAFRTTGVKLN